MRKTVTVPQSSVGLLYENGAFARLLPPGRHELGKRFFDDVAREVTLIDIRERSLTIKGQEILTADKAAIRISLLVYFRVTDSKAALHNVSSYEERIYEDVQIAARHFLASRALADILTDRNEISDAVKADVKASAAGYGVEILRADVKDLVFPGNLREIMNQVLEVERRSEAKLIEARREAEVLKIQAEAEAAGTRAKLELQREQDRSAAESERDRAKLKLETQIQEAKVLAEHPQLLRLRELSTLAEMARVGGKFVVGLPGTTLGRSGSRTEIWRRRSVPPLEELDGPLVLLGGCQRVERAEVPALARPRILLARVDPVLAVLQLPDHAAKLNIVGPRC
jgi:regulator of protease activity HflC (stomatin/prohibitin superfamily)